MRACVCIFAFWLPSSFLHGVHLLGHGTAHGHRLRLHLRVGGALHADGLCGLRSLVRRDGRVGGGGGGDDGGVEVGEGSGGGGGAST